MSIKLKEYKAKSIFWLCLTLLLVALGFICGDTSYILMAMISTAISVIFDVGHDILKCITGDQDENAIILREPPKRN